MARSNINHLRTLLCLSVMVAAAGCAAVPQGASRADSPAQADRPDIDPTRAYLSLDQIDPPVQSPSPLDSLEPLSQRAAEMIAAAQRLVAQQRFTEGALKLERALRSDPDHPNIHRALAALHWNAGNFERAKSHAADALAVNNDDAGSHYLLGRCAAHDADHVAAIDEFRTALQCSDPAGEPETMVLCHYHLAEALAEAGYLQAALDQYDAFEQRAAAVDPQQTGAELRSLILATGGNAALPRSVILETLGRYDQAAQTLAPKVAGEPHKVELGIRYAGLLARAHRIDHALAAARALPFQADTILPLLSDIYAQSGHPERLIGELREWGVRYPDEPSIFQHLSAALVQSDRTAQALDVLQGYLERHPTHHDIRMELLDLLVAQRAWPEALRVGAEGISAQPNRTHEISRKLSALAEKEDARRFILGDPKKLDGGFAGQHLRGTFAAAAGETHVAEAHYRAALSDEPSFVPSRVALARLYLKTYQYDRAQEAAARRDPEVADDKRLEMVLGEIYERLDDFARAERHYESATRLDATNEESMIALARTYRHSGQQLRARRQLQTLLQRRPENQEARESLAFLHLGEGRIKEAIREFEQLKRSASTPTTRARASAILQRLERQDPQEFRKTLLDAMEESGADAPTWLAIADSFNDYSETTQKTEAYEQVLRLDPENVSAALGLALVEQKQLNFAASAKRLRELLKRRPNRHRWRLGTRDMRGLLELLYAMQDAVGILEISRRQEARDDISDSTRVAYRLWILEGHLRSQAKEEALKLLRQWSQEDTDHHLWAGALAEEYLREDRPAEAVSVYQSVLREDPQNRDVMNGLISALVADKRHARAAQISLDWLADDPGDDRAVWMLTYALALSQPPAREGKGAGRVDEALELIRNRLLTSLNREYFQNLMIRHLNSADRSADAIEFIDRLLGEVISLMESINDPHLRKSLESESNDRTIHQPNEPFAIDTLHRRLAELRQLLGNAYIGAKRYNEAERELIAWLDKSRVPRIRLAYLGSLATCLQLQGYEERAAETLERALRLAPDNVTLSNDLAYTWIEQGVRLDDATRMARFAVWSSPRQGAYLDTYGWLLYKKGSFSAAKKWLLRAKTSNVGADPVVLDHLGDTSWRLGKRDQAIEYWAAAVEAVNQRDENALLGADAQRVRDQTGNKIEAARAAGEPEVAPVADPSRGL